MQTAEENSLSPIPHWERSPSTKRNEKLQWLDHDYYVVFIADMLLGSLKKVFWKIKTLIPNVYNKAAVYFTR